MRTTCPNHFKPLKFQSPGPLQLSAYTLHCMQACSYHQQKSFSMGDKGVDIITNLSTLMLHDVTELVSTLFPLQLEAMFDV